MVAPDDTPEPAPDPVRSPLRRRAGPAAIELEIGGALVRIGSSADADTIAAVILALEDIETARGSAQAERDAAVSKARGERPRKTNRGLLPAHLERIEQVIDVEDKTCSCCGGALHQIGEDVAERLDVVPTTFRVLVTRRPRYGCRACESAVVQAPAPARIVEGGIPTQALIAQVLVSRHADHLPLYRQAQIHARQGIHAITPAMTDLGAALTRRWLPMSMPPIARLSEPGRISRALRASCRSTANTKAR
jgi:transposase